MAKSQKNRPIDPEAEETALASGEPTAYWSSANVTQSLMSSFSWMRGSAKLNRFVEPPRPEDRSSIAPIAYSPISYAGEVLCARSSIRPVLPWTPYVDENGMAYVCIRGGAGGGDDAYVAIPANQFLISFKLPREGE